MQPKKRSGQAPFVFTYCEDLHSLPQSALALEKGLHGGFAVDKRSGQGQIYYGLAGCGLLRISPDLTTQESAIFSHKGSCDYISPNTSTGTDFEFLGDDITTHGARHDDSVGSDVFTSHTSGFANHEHTS